MTARLRQDEDLLLVKQKTTREKKLNIRPASSKHGYTEEKTYKCQPCRFLRGEGYSNKYFREHSIWERVP